MRVYRPYGSPAMKAKWYLLDANNKYIDPFTDLNVGWNDVTWDTTGETFTDPVQEVGIIVEGSGAYNGSIYLDNGNFADTTPTATPVIFNIVKSISTNIAVFGSTLTYTIAYTNPSAFELSEITIYDSIPAITDFIDCDSGGVTDGGTPNVVSWSLTNIPAGGTGEVKFRVKVARYP